MASSSNRSDSEVSRTIGPKVSAFLRHRATGLTPDGYMRLKQVAATLKISEADLRAIVRGDPKSRFGLRTDHGETWIRAVQGHSISGVEVGDKVAPPAQLFHITTAEASRQIMESGLQARRNDVHMVANGDWHLARKLPGGITIRVNTREAMRRGVQFRRADNGVWLSGNIPASALSIAGKAITASFRQLSRSDSNPNSESKWQDVKGPLVHYAAVSGGRMDPMWRELVSWYGEPIGRRQVGRYIIQNTADGPVAHIFICEQPEDRPDPNIVRETTAAALRALARISNKRIVVPHCLGTAAAARAGGPALAQAANKLGVAVDILP